MAARGLRILPGLAVLAACGAAGYWSVRLAYADALSRGEARDEATWALRMAPEDAGSHVRMAAWLKRNGADPRPELERAACLNPADYQIWMELALENEASRDYTAAERYLLRAANAGRCFEPRWLLANFYFRRGNAGQFWRWARDALPLSYEDPAPLFQLCWQMSDDAEEIGKIVPDNRRLLCWYLRFLAGAGKLTEALPVAHRLLPLAGDEDLQDLLAFCDRLLNHRQPAAAMEVWSGICRRGLLPADLLPVPGGNLIIDGKFEHEPAGGFDWHLGRVFGVTTFRVMPGGLHAQFSGKQPEQCDVLTQLVPLTAPRSYCLRFEYRTFDILPESGLRWVVADAYSGAEVPLDRAALSGESWTTGEIRFRVARGLELARISLSYRRVPGATRIEGSIDLRQVELTATL